MAGGAAYATISLDSELKFELSPRNWTSLDMMKRHKPLQVINATDLDMQLDLRLGIWAPFL